jgi:sarcosine oxidase
MAKTFDAIVLGTGGLGSAALMHLARQRLRVLGLEQFHTAHNRGSSHGHTRAIRQAYFEHPSYVPLLQRAYELWDELEQNSGQHLLRRTGLLQVGSPQGELITGVKRTAELHRLPVSELDPGRLRRHFPQFRVPRDAVALWEQNAGYLLVERCVATHLDLALRLGAELRTEESVVDWHPLNGQLRVVSEKQDYLTERLVICGGPWSQRLLPHLESQLNVLRKHVFWLEPSEAMYHVDQGCPVFFFETAEGFFYGFPKLETYGVKVAEHSGGDPLPDFAQHPPSTIDSLCWLEDEARQRQESWQRVSQFARDCLPGLTPTISAHARCWYTMTPDGHFVVDLQQTPAPVAFAAGLSGHGFKFATVLGEVLMELVLHGRTRHPIDFLRASRLKSQDTVHA